jgi:hypothetical protein
MDSYEYQRHGLYESRRHEYNTSEFWYESLSINDIVNSASANSRNVHNNIKYKSAEGTSAISRVQY